METRRWVNQSQPQTLYMATILLYISAAIGLLFGGFATVLGLAFIVGEAVGAYGIANERRWGYVLALVAVGVEVSFLALAVVLDRGLLLNVIFLINAVWPVALLVLLLHPMSRDYQRIWFK